MKSVALVSQKVYHARPVELTELDETELDIAGLVLQERLAGGGNVCGNGVERAELKIGVVARHSGGQRGKTGQCRIADTPL